MGAPRGKGKGKRRQSGRGARQRRRELHAQKVGKAPAHQAKPPAHPAKPPGHPAKPPAHPAKPPPHPAKPPAHPAKPPGQQQRVGNCHRRSVCQPKLDRSLQALRPKLTGTGNLCRHRREGFFMIKEINYRHVHTCTDSSIQASGRSGPSWWFTPATRSNLFQKACKCGCVLDCSKEQCRARKSRTESASRLA